MAQGQLVCVEVHNLGEVEEEVAGEESDVASKYHPQLLQHVVRRLPMILHNLHLNSLDPADNEDVEAQNAEGHVGVDGYFCDGRLQPLRTMLLITLANALIQHLVRDHQWQLNDHPEGQDEVRPPQLLFLADADCVEG